MDVEHVFKALADHHRRHLLDVLSQNGGLTLNELAAHLPEGAYIESLRASNDTVAVDGAAESGARVFQTVAGSSVLAGITPVGPIRRDESDNAGAAAERFTLSARVSNAAPLVPATKRGAR